MTSVIPGGFNIAGRAIARVERQCRQIDRPVATFGAGSRSRESSLVFLEMLFGSRGGSRRPAWLVTVWFRCLGWVGIGCRAEVFVRGGR